MVLHTLQPAKRSGRCEHLTRFKQRFDSRKDHGPAAKELVVGPLVQLILRITPRRVLAVSGWASVADASDSGVKSGARPNKSRRNREFVDVA